MGKSVIFVAGTAYSGSTLLDMILANDPVGFSCGEISALVRPFRSHHVDPPCGCGDAGCNIWRDEAMRSESAHLELFEQRLDAQFHVDSSKSIPWILDQTALLQASGIDTYNVLIWKRPAQYLKSRRKRNQTVGWLRTWVNYHRHYFTAMPHWVSIPYEDLVSSKDALEMLCQRLDIQYFEGKERYWEKTQHTLFGNSSAKIHLYGSDSAEFQRMNEELHGQNCPRGSSSVTTGHRQLYLDSGDDTGVSLNSKQQETVRSIEKTLMESDVRNMGGLRAGIDRSHACWDSLAGFRRLHQRSRQRIQQAMLRWAN